MDMNIQTVISLPALFPNIITLKWVEESNCVRSIDHPTKTIYEEALKNWDRIEKIIDRPKHLHITTSLLGSQICNNLKELDIKFYDCTPAGDNHDHTLNRFMLQDLVQNIHNAPMLESITLGMTAFRLTDLENLHAGLPKLQDVKLDQVFLYNNEGGNIVVGSPANSLKSFNISLTSVNQFDVLSIEFERTIANWFTYVGEKYHNLERFEARISGFGIAPLYNATVLEEPLALAASKLVNLKSYVMQIHPMTINILNAMDSSDIHLKRLKVWVHTHDLEMQLQLFRSSLRFAKSTSTIETLELDCFGIRDKDEARLVVRQIHLLSFGWINLTRLVIDGGSVTLLLDILQDLTMIEDVKYTLFGLGGTQGITDDRTLTPCNLKTLDIDIIAHCTNSDALALANQTMDFILGSCSLLQTFKLSAHFMGSYLPGAFNLRLKNHTNLERISIDNLGGCKYYTLNEEPGQQEHKWKSYDKEVKIGADDGTLQDGSYYINLEFEECQTKVNLGDCTKRNDND